MFFSIITLGSLVALVAAAPANVPTAIVNNKCSYGVSIWSTGAGPTYIGPNSVYSEPLVGNQKTLLVEQGQHAPGDIYADTPKLSFGYSVQGSRVWYDLNTLSGGFAQSHVILAGTGAGCSAIDFPTGATPNPDWNFTTNCDAPSDVTLTICA